MGRPKESPQSTPRGNKEGTHGSKEFTMHIQGHTMPLREQRKKLMQSLEKINAQIEHDEEERAGEGKPLIGDVDGEIFDPSSAPSTARSESSYYKRKRQMQEIANEEEAEKVRHHFEYPSEAGLVIFQVCMSLGYCGYVVTSWLYIGAVRDEVLPNCSNVWPYSHELQAVCDVSILAFWTFPIFCCIFLLIFFYRDLLSTRMYYEMLCHNVYLDMENVDFFKSRPVRILLFWMVLGMMMYPATGNFHLHGVKATLGYWIPIMSFLGMLYSTWDLETRLLSLAKYVEREFDDAKVHMHNSVFIRDYFCKKAFERVRDTARKVDKIHTTGSYIKAIVKMAEKMATEKQWTGEVEAEIENEAAGYDSFFVAFSKKYWVADFLYCPALEDTRARKFRNWFRAYAVYTFLLMALFLYLFVATVVSHLHHQGVLESSLLTQMFKVDHFMVVPVGPSHSKDVTGKPHEFLFKVADRLHRL